jgi:hypothetical protein
MSDDCATAATACSPAIVIINKQYASNTGLSDITTSIAMAFRAAHKLQVAEAQLMDVMSTAMAAVRQLRQMVAQNRDVAAEAAQLMQQVEEQRHHLLMLAMLLGLEARAAAQDLHLDRFGAAMRHIMAEARATQQQVQQQQ